MHHPNTYMAVVPDTTNNNRPDIFDPALRQYSRAFRVGDPAFPNEADRQTWNASRLQVISRLLQIIADSPWRDHLVLRGSLCLHSWFGEMAREPGDIDWVFHSTTVKSSDVQAEDLMAYLQRVPSRYPTIGDIVLQSERIATDQIWTYERADGRRIVYPWQREGFPTGYVQMDIVFGEPLFTDPVETEIAIGEGQNVRLWTADKTLSLAWKLLWLETDSYPQGKDLYDAVLLAETTTLSLDLLYKVLPAYEEYYRNHTLTPDFPMKWDIDWNNFLLEYPWIAGKASDWQRRLTKALAPMFKG